MKNILFTIAATLVFLHAFAQIPAGYYSSTAGLTGDSLKAALNNIIDGHTELTYTEVKEALKQTDEDPADTNKVICLYSGWSYAKIEFGNGSEQWNREHVWSKSHGNFGDLPPAGTDLHHLRPADASVNSAKNNRDFDYGITQYIDGSGPTDCYTNTYIWEPRDSVKGDVARMIFYMATRYEGENGEPDLEIVDYVNTAPANDSLYGKLSTLLAWHHADTVDDRERNRNDIIYYTYQGNRNPFIDHPEYVDSIWTAPAGGGSTSTSLFISEVADPANAAYAKYVELYNAGSTTINFGTDTWYLSRQANGSTWSNVQLVDSIRAGETYIISYNTTAFFNSYGFNADLNSGTVSGNGDDGYFLYHGGNNATGTLVDAYGVKNVDGTGQPWEYTDAKAVRIFSVTAPDSSWKASHWYVSSAANDSDMTPGWHRRLLQWNGTTSTDWHTAANWTDGTVNSAFIPDAGSHVSISSFPNKAIVSGEASCGGITVNGTNSFTLGTGSVLTVGGN
ncbi:MAG: endonuclease [Bacteroidales bacterium]|nr:endonuclease [Bacteroidales bacterium]